MKKETKVLLTQFIIFAIVFLIIRYAIVYFDLLQGYWIPIAGGIIATLICPQFKVLMIDGKKITYAAWLVRKKAIEIKWL